MKYVNRNNVSMKPTCDIIKKYSKGRIVAMLGDSLTLRNELKEYYNIDCNLVLTMLKDNLVNNTELKHLDTVRGQSNSYYIVIPFLDYSLKIKNLLIDYGYREFSDFVFTNHEKIIVSSDNMNEYHDEYGNHISFSEKGGTVILMPSAGNNIFNGKSVFKTVFTGQGNSVNIGKNIKSSSSFQLTVNNNSSIQISDNVKMSPRFFQIMDGATFAVGENSYFDNTGIVINKNSKLIVGRHCSVLYDRIRTGPNREIRIGDDVMFSWDVTILGHDGHMIFDLKTNKCINNSAGECKLSIDIGSHVWLGGDCVIMPDTIIGAGSIVAYRAMARGKYPNNVVIGGIPGKVIKQDVAWTRENICLSDDLLNNLDEAYRRMTDLSNI